MSKKNLQIVWREVTRGTVIQVWQLRHLASFVEAIFTTERTKTESYGVETPNGTENFRNFQISGKMNNLESLTRIFEMSFRKFSVPFDFLPEFSEILVEWNTPTVFLVILSWKGISLEFLCTPYRKRSLINTYAVGAKSYLWSSYWLPDRLQWRAGGRETNS